MHNQKGVSQSSHHSSTAISSVVSFAATGLLLAGGDGGDFLSVVYWMKSMTCCSTSGGRLELWLPSNRYIFLFSPLKVSKSYCEWRWFTSVSFVPERKTMHLEESICYTDFLIFSSFMSKSARFFTSVRSLRNMSGKQQATIQPGT